MSVYSVLWPSIIKYMYVLCTKDASLDSYFTNVVINTGFVVIDTYCKQDKLMVKVYLERLYGVLN